MTGETFGILVRTRNAAVRDQGTSGNHPITRGNLERASVSFLDVISFHFEQFSSACVPRLILALGPRFRLIQTNITARNHISRSLSLSGLGALSNPSAATWAEAARGHCGVVVSFPFCHTCNLVPAAAAPHRAHAHGLTDGLQHTPHRTAPHWTNASRGGCAVAHHFHTTFFLLH